jgi:hypothetical protein
MTLEFIAFYVGPDQVMPLASIFATIAGFLLIFWNKIVGLFQRFGFFRRSPGSESGPAEKKSPPQE